MNILEILGYTKSEHEREVLSEFLDCLFKDNLVAYTLEPKEPDEPDVLVKLPAKEEYYELARILDRGWIRLRLEALMNPGKQVIIDASKFGLPEKDIVVSKLEKTYTTNLKDLNLLLYYDTGIFNGGYPPIELKQLCDDVIRPVILEDCIFKSIYIFDRRSQMILWHT